MAEHTFVPAAGMILADWGADVIKIERTTGGGRANVRQALCMPALVAARFNPDLKAKYQQLIAQGKPAKIAITAVMRKLVVIANTLLKADRLWVKSLA